MVLISGGFHHFLPPLLNVPGFASPKIFYRQLRFQKLSANAKLVLHRNKVCQLSMISSVTASFNPWRS
jgi:hypothetical protein